VTASVVPIAAGPSLDAAVEEFLARPRLDRGTARSYAQALTRLARDLDAGGPLGQVSPEQVADAFTAAWDGVAPRTWNRHLAAVRSFRSWAAGRWPVVDLAAHLERRKENPDRTKVIDRHRIEALWERRDIPLREKTLWRLLYESAARAQEVLGLNIEDLDLDNKRGRATRKGGRVEWIQWQSGAARLLPRLVAGRTRGPVFLAERRPARTRTPAAADLCPPPAAAGCPTSAPSTCSRRPPAERPSTSSATPG